MPDASWKGLAAGLYRREEKTALEALKEYLSDRQGELISHLFMIHILIAVYMTSTAGVLYI